MMMFRHDAHVLIVGGGGTGGALAHDLALRGIRVTLVERGELTSGTTGRHHGLLHSGGRYAVGDHESAVECIEENRILRRICPGSFELNDGLFVGVEDEDLEYLDPFLEGCAACGIPAERLTPAEAFRLEPNLNPALKVAVRIPDGTIDAMRLALRFFATARHNGAVIRPYTEVTDLLLGGGVVTGAVVRDHATARSEEIHADLVVNATGPWSEKIALMAGVDVPIRPSPGVLLALRGRLCNMVINRLHKSGDGDIVVPQRGLSVVGTSSWVVEDPDELDVPEDHVERMYSEGSKLIPAVRTAERRAAWSAARPLVGSRGEGESGRELSRTFKTFDHKETDGIEGFVTITGGKATTLRGMAELCADVVCRKLDVDEPCRTRETVLLPHTAYYAAAAA
ncbi:MAG TPA: FAD-dependent oxidoreductase [Solirubrobacteraceae bacterium]|nr:FAD-dependent oxidoreductase [Solirubrobacteraceae bacterium]